MYDNKNLKFDWTRIKHDINGNPRYVIHFLNLLTDDEKANWPIMGMGRGKYEIACKRANKIGGRKYNTRSYRGGIVFSSYALEDEERAIFELLAKG